MNRIRRLARSFVRLIKLVVQELGIATVKLLRGHHLEARAHSRAALQILHEDLASIATLCCVARQNKARDESPRILIIKLDRVGDMVNTTPVFDVLRSRFPNASIDVCGHPVVLTLLEGDPRIQGRFSYISALYHDVPIGIPGVAHWKLIRQLWRTRYHAVVYLRGSFPFLLLAFQTRFYLSRFVEGEPVIHRYLKAIDCETGDGEVAPAPSLNISMLSKRKVAQLFPRHVNQPRVIIHAVSAAEGKQWPLERFARVADELVARVAAEVLFLAAPSERDKLDVVKACCSQSHLFVTELRLPEVVAAISDADFFIGNDSGLAHIAAAVRTPELVIWGAANLSMARPVASPENCEILFREVSCRATCNEERCTSVNYIKCLEMIGVSEVVDSAIRQLRKFERGGAP